MRSPWFPGDWPVTQEYGCTDYAGEGYNPNHPECTYFHDGIDIGIPCGTVLYSGVNGTVVQRGIYGGGPYALILESNGWWVWLLHMQNSWVFPGDRVSVGQPIAEVGTLGFSTGCHIHFQVTPAGYGYRESVNPGPWLGEGFSGPFPLGAPQLPWQLPYGGQSLEELKQALRDVLNEGTGDGQASWAGTSRAMLGTTQDTWNRLSLLLAAVANISVASGGLSPAKLADALEAFAQELRK